MRFNPIFYPGKFFVIAGLFWGLSVGSAWAIDAGAPVRGAKKKATPAAREASAERVESVSIKLQRYLQEAEAQMGELQPWQKRIYQEEVVPQSGRFVRAFRQSATGLEVDIDREAILNYLRFYGPKFLGKEKPEVLIALRPEADCEKCQASLGEIKKLVKERVERRGLVPVWVGGEQIDPKWSGKALDHRLVRLGVETKKAVQLAVEWHKAIPDDEDAGHADELKFTVRSSLLIRGLPAQEGQLDIFDTGSFEKTISQLLTDFFTEVGGKSEKPSLISSDVEKGSYFLEVKGIRGFSHYLKIKNQIFQIASSTRDEVSVEERRISRGKVAFNIYTRRDIDAIRALFAKLSADDSIQVEIRL